MVVSDGPGSKGDPLWVCVSGRGTRWQLGPGGVTPPGEDTVPVLCYGGVTSLCLLVSSESGPGGWGTVSLAHRPREDRIGTIWLVTSVWTHLVTEDVCPEKVSIYK